MLVPTPPASPPQLSAAVCAVSTAGAAFLLVRDVPPFLLAGWRLQVVSVLLAPAFIIQARSLGGAQRARLRAAAPRLWLAGCFLALHFALWVASTQLTSLPHALLFVSATPVVLAAAALARRAPLSRGELLGTGLAMAGAALVVADKGRAGSDGAAVGVAPTRLGDCSALLAACALAGYLSVGAELRSWCPLFVYAAPVNAVAALLLTAAGRAGGGAAGLGAASHAVAGYLHSDRYFSTVIYLAVVPGVVGHVGINSVLSVLSPLVVTLALTAEPVLGSLAGVAVGLSAWPGPAALAGGGLMLLATVWVVLAEARRKRAAAALAAADAAAAAALHPVEGPQPGGGAAAAGAAAAAAAAAAAGGGSGGGGADGQLRVSIHHPQDDVVVPADR